MSNPSSPQGLSQIVRMQGIEWGDGAAHDYHLWWDGNQLWCDGQIVVGLLVAGNALASTNANGAALTVAAGDGDGTGSGGNLQINSGNGGSSGLAGSVTIGVGASKGTNPGALVTVLAGQGGTGTGGRGGTAGLAGGNAGSGSNGNGGRVSLQTGSKDGSGIKPLVELDANGAVPTTAVLAQGYVGLKYNAGGTLVAYVNDGGSIKSLSLGTPS